MRSADAYVGRGPSLNDAMWLDLAHSRRLPCGIVEQKVTVRSVTTTGECLQATPQGSGVLVIGKDNWVNELRVLSSVPATYLSTCIPVATYGLR